MHPRLIAAAVAAGIAVVLVFMALLASGPPGAPTVTISQQPNPNSAETYTISVEYREYSLLTPSFFGWNGQSSVVNAYWIGASGAKNVVEQDQHMVTSVLTSSGGLYTLGTTFSFAVPQQCSSTCSGNELSIVVSAYGINPMGEGWTSATGAKTTATFNSSTTLSQDPVAPPLPPTGPYYFELYGALTMAGLAGSLGAAVAWGPAKVYAGSATVIFALALFAEIFILGW